MARLILLVAPALANRVHVHDSTQAFAHLSHEDSLTAVAALDALERLKADINDEEAGEIYRNAIGEIHWEEARAFLNSGMDSNQEPVLLGQQSTSDTTLNLAELLSGRQTNGVLTRVGRLFTGRRDFAVEEPGGETKYCIDGIVRSLHSRMQVFAPNEHQPRYVIRRAFNYLNPVATTVGQYIYRVLRCEPDSEGGWAGACTEGDILYTITKDRFGRGALWGQDEYRVYTGTGGCSRHGQGILSCSRDRQIMYSLSEGLGDNSHDTNFYAGAISALDSGFESGRMHSGEELDARTIASMKVARVAKSSGSPRALAWPQTWAANSARAGAGIVGITYLQIIELSHRMSEYQALSMVAGATAGSVQIASESAFAGESWGLIVQGLVGVQVAAVAGNAAMFLAATYHLAKSLVWADAYTLTFDAPTDELLVSIVAGVQDLTREQHFR